ncbi:hypothetical protein EPN15_03030 [Patescibacteria group bacterium]|nr:MAG: hypothetical protein EPN15_03030 [Patescibacteria group bacterium]
MVFASTLYGCDLFSKETDEQIWKRIQIALNQDTKHLPEDALSDISKLINRGSSFAERHEVLDALVMTGAFLLDENANWIDKSRARTVYNVIEKGKDDIAVEALVRNVLQAEHRLQILFLGIKLGIPGSEEKLVNALMSHGDKQMAEDYLNSGSSKLYDGGKQWAEANGYSILTGPGSTRAHWGRF